MDIWERLQSVEQNYFAIKEQLTATASTLPDPVFVIDRFGKYLDVIGGKERSLYNSGELLVGRYLHDVLPHDLADTFMQATTEAIATNSLQTIEYQLGPGDMAGSPLSGPTDRQWFEGRLYPLRDRNQEIHSVVWMTINITEKKKLEEQVRDLAERDFLTGAYNRSHFMKIFEKEFSIAKRYRNRLAFLLLDIDNFKKINESYGIDTGDAVMKRLVILCEATLRNSDLFARYAGGAFSAMLPNTPRLGGAIIAERIRAAVEELRIPYGKETIRFTVSMGISLAQDTDTNSSGVLSRAEAALYQAKKKGRNRIEIG